MIINIILFQKDNAMLKFVFSGRIITAASRPDSICNIPQKISYYLENNSHHHDFKEVMAVVKGDCIFKLNGKYFHLQAGDLVLLNPMDNHTEGHYPDRNSVYYWGSFWTDMIRIHLWEKNRISDSGFLSLGTFSDFIYNLWDEISARGNIEAEEELSHIITSVINCFLREDRQQKYSFPHGFRYDIMKKIIEYIENTPSLNCTLDSLSILAGYSKIHFQRCFIEHTGMTFREYILKKRIERYFSIIGSKNFSLKEIAYKLGFSSTAALLHWKQRNKKKFHL